MIYNEGVAAFNSGDDENAEQAFLQALESDRYHLQARIGLAEVYLRQRSFELCLQQVSEILALAPDNPSALRIGERARARMGRPPEP